jgi:murein DD-endopeptidase MepM/ murein hydrolase activator NlpD
VVASETMTSSASVAQSKLSCPACDGPVEVKSRHVAIKGTVVRVYCSADCLRTGAKPAVQTPVPVAAPPRRRRRGWWLAGSAVGAVMIVSTAVYALDEEEDNATPPPPAYEAATVAPPPTKLPSTEPDPRVLEDQALTREILQDTWIHPLAGPARRMPANHNGAFGASRPGERAPECVSGHCGVDIGHNWGEPVHAVHDGVVDWVNRGPNEENGGIFVKIAHRDGTLFSWYFHLAAVPRWVQPGVKIAAGQVIGLLGDTGIKHSAPHLHFSLTVKTGKARERYLDPEPMIAIWPLWIADESGRGKPSPAVTAPGVPVRERPTAKRTKPAAPAEPAPAPEPAADPVPEPTEPTTN